MRATGSPWGLSRVRPGPFFHPRGAALHHEAPDQVLLAGEVTDRLVVCRDDRAARLEIEAVHREDRHRTRLRRRQARGARQEREEEQGERARGKESSLPRRGNGAPHWMYPRERRRSSRATRRRMI